MANDPDLLSVSTGQSSNRLYAVNRKAFPVVLAVATVAFAGCNADRGVDVSARTAVAVAPSPYFPKYNPYDPVHYAQTSGFYGGR